MESFLSLGRLHIPLMGVFAAAGLMCAMTLGLRTAVLAGVDPDAFWNLGFVSVLAAFVISRAALVIENLHTFLQFPMAVLELPTLSGAGLICTLVFAFICLRHWKLPMLGVLDGAAPPFALLLAFLSVGAWMSGTRQGIPTTLPWSVASSFGRVHPVEVYAAFTWMLLSAVTFAVLRRRPLRGITAGLGLALGGLMNALLSFARLPNQLYGNQALDGEQWHGLELVVLGGLLIAWRFAQADRTAAARKEVAARAL